MTKRSHYYVNEETVEKKRAYDRSYSEIQRKRARALKLCHRCRKGERYPGTSTCIHCKRKLAILHMENLRKADRTFYDQVYLMLAKPIHTMDTYPPTRSPWSARSPKSA